MTGPPSVWEPSISSSFGSVSFIQETQKWQAKPEALLTCVSLQLLYTFYLNQDAYFRQQCLVLRVSSTRFQSCHKQRPDWKAWEQSARIEILWEHGECFGNRKSGVEADWKTLRPLSVLAVVHPLYPTHWLPVSLKHGSQSWFIPHFLTFHTPSFRLLPHLVLHLSSRCFRV